MIGGKDGGNTMGKRIDLGAGDIRDGESSPDGYLRQDVDASIEGLDIICPIEELDKYVESESCERLRISHVLEHFATAEVPNILSVLYKCLEKGGELEVIVPNFAWHASLVQQGRDEDAVMYAFGGQLDQWDFHKTGFTPKILYERVSEAGFTIKELLNESSITLIAVK